MNKEKVIFIVGPTGVGKTEAGLRLAELLPIEIVSADSMQIYKGMDILTDKLPKALRKKHPCHLIDIVAPTRGYNVASFVKAAKKAFAKIWKKKKIPVVIGGTGLYVNSLLYGIFESASKNDSVRNRLEAEAKERGIDILYERLNHIDCEAASKINKNDARRIIRALEVYEITKRPLSILQKERSGLKEECQVFLFGLRRQRQDLYKRIEQRVDFMFNSGLLDEVRNLLKKKLSQTAYFCIGIREVEGFLKGSYSLDEAIRLMKRNSRHFAKRQLTWFNKDKNIEWIDVKEGQNLTEVARKILERVES